MAFTRYFLLAACALLTQISGAAADPAACLSVSDPTQRLACYDRELGRKPDVAAASKGDFKAVDLTDLKTDIKEMRGRKVEVEGKLTLFAGMAMLGAAGNGYDSSPVMVSLEKVPREQRREIISKCGIPCDAMIQGTVGEVLMNPGLIGASVTLR